MNQTETSPPAPSHEAQTNEEQIRKTYVKQLKAGEAIHTVFRATRKEVLSSRSGKPYMVIGLVDRTGEVDARIFENIDVAQAAFTEGDYLLVQGKVGHFHGNPQIIIETLERLDPEPIDEREFAFTPPPPTDKAAKPEKSSDRPRDDDTRGQHKAARQRVMRWLDHPHVASALDVLVTHLERIIDERIAQKLSHAPARPERPERPERKSRGPFVEHKGREPESKGQSKSEHEHKTEHKKDVLPEGLAFKPFSQLIGEESAPPVPTERYEGNLEGHEGFKG